jgi:hypothetical protein
MTGQNLAVCEVVGCAGKNKPLRHVGSKRCIDSTWENFSMKRLIGMALATALVACGGGGSNDASSPQIKISALTFKQVQENQQPSQPIAQSASQVVAADPFKAFLAANKK